MTIENLGSGKRIWAPEAKLRQLLIWPNKVFYSFDGREIVIVLKRSQTTPRFSFCVNNIQSFGVEGEKVRVRLIELDGTFIAETSLADIIEEVKGETPLRSRFDGWGDFFWLTEDFKISRPEEFYNRAPIGSSAIECSAIEYLTGRKRARFADRGSGARSINLVAVKTMRE